MEAFKQELTDKIQLLKKKGVVLTTPRLIILEFLVSNRIHPTAEEIFNALKKKYPSISQASIYNTIKLFVKLGIVSELFVEKERARYDINTTPHAHFKCLKCGKVYDVKKPLPQMEEIEGHQVALTQIYFYGTCNECLKKAKRRE